MLDLQTKYKHGDSSMLQLRLAATLEVLDASVGREPGLLVWSGWELYLIKTPSMRSLIMLLVILVRQCSHQETLRGPRNQLDPERRARSRRPSTERPCSWPNPWTHGMFTKP